MNRYEYKHAINYMYYIIFFMERAFHYIEMSLFNYV